MKKTIKFTVQMLALIIVSPLLLAYQLLLMIGDGNALIAAFSQTLSLLPGKFGSYLRVAFYRIALRHCSSDCFIGFGTLFSQRDIEIHAHVYIGPQCNIGSACIKSHCLLGSGVHILSGKRQHGTLDLTHPMHEQPGRLEKITIGEDCWIGNGAIVMADMGRQCIVGAGSVITEPLDDFSIVAGNPARLIRKRNQ